MEKEFFKNTLHTFFSGQATPLQKKLVEEWLTDTGSTEKYYEWLEEWEREHPQFLPDTEEALKAFVMRTADEESNVILNFSSKPIKPKFSQWLTYAAACVAFIILTIFIGRDYIEYKTYSTDFAEVKTLRLEDGSEVVLNANSMLRVPRFRFGEKSREVFLEGEAQFSVVHTKSNQKFLVHTPDKLEVEVLGTEFIVFSRERGSKVVLNKGKVALRSLQDTIPKTLTIKPGDVVTIQKGVFNVKEKQAVQSHAAWKEHRFIFDHTPLNEIATQIEESFGLKMKISDEVLAKRELTGTYEAETVHELLDVLVRILDVEIKQNGKYVLLVPGGKGAVLN